LVAIFQFIRKFFNGGREMRWEVIDVETTGFSKAYDNIVSFAYAELSADLETVVEADVLYFYKRGMKWSMEAQAVHGLTQEFLSQFEDQYSTNLKKMFKKVARANMVGFNNDGFDNGFISNFLDREMYGPQNYNSSTDIMKVFQPVFGRRQKLSELTYALGVNDFILGKLSEKWFGKPFGWHEAHGDVVATTFCLLEARRRKLI
jgi:DNA polymerase III epsilon subunit-like protein